MKMINCHIKKFKTCKPFNPNDFTSPKLPASLQPAEKPFNQICFPNQLQSFYAGCKITESTKSEGKVRKKWITQILAMKTS